MLELLERCSAEIGVEPLTINRNSFEFAQVRGAGYFVVLVAFVPLQGIRLNPFHTALEEVIGFCINNGMT